MTDVLKFAKETGISEVFFNYINLVANNWDLSKYGFYSSTEFRSELNKAIEFAELNKIYIEYPKFKKENKFEDCPYLWNNIYITWDSYVVPCCAKPFPKELNFGNIRERKFIDCLNHNEFQYFRELAVSNTVPAFCKRCHYVN